MKFFCVSDIHGYFDEFKAALDVAGFDPDNESHWLISCGDYFDRGRQPMEVMNYLKMLPRKILIRGNHEDLLEQCYSRRIAFSHDIHNGTAMTILDVGSDSTTDEFGDCCVRAGKRLQSFLDGMVNYFETQNYIFVHAWVPVSVYNWRESSDRDWDKSRWLNPFEIFDNARVAVKSGFGAQAAAQDDYKHLSAHYGFEPIFCNPASGNEKGLVENLVGYIRRNVCVPLPKVKTLDELNGKLLEKCVRYLEHQIEGSPATVGTMLEEDRQCLQTMPHYTPDISKKVYPTVSRYSTVTFETNHYSVPSRYCGKNTTLKAHPNHVEVWIAGALAARHDRLFG